MVIPTQLLYIFFTFSYKILSQYDFKINFLAYISEMYNLKLLKDCMVDKKSSSHSENQKHRLLPSKNTVCTHLETFVSKT